MVFENTLQPLTCTNTPARNGDPLFGSAQQSYVPPERIKNIDAFLLTFRSKVSAFLHTKINGRLVFRGCKWCERAGPPIPHSLNPLNFGEIELFRRQRLEARTFHILHGESLLPRVIIVFDQVQPGSASIINQMVNTHHGSGQKIK